MKEASIKLIQIGMRTGIEEHYKGFSFVLQTIRHGYIKSLTFKFCISSLLRLGMQRYHNLLK